MSDYSRLSIELQASIEEMRANGMSEPVIARWVDRMYSALAVERNAVQVDLWSIGKQLTTQIGDRLGEVRQALQADAHAMNGATNDMFSDILNGLREQGAALETARAEFRAGMQSIGERVNDMDLWRVEVDNERASFRASRDESKAQRTRTEHAVTELAEQFELFVREIHTMIAQGPTPDEVVTYRAFLDEQMRKAREAGG